MRLVVFDVDGTLVDSQHHIHSAMGLAFAGNGLPAPTLDDVHAIIGLSLPLAIARLAPEADDPLTARLVADYKDSFVSRRVKEDAPLFPGARDSVMRLAGRGDLLLGLATGKGRRGIEVMLDNHDLRGVFATIQCADDHPSKPHPAMLEAALAEVGVPAARAVMVGDTTFDIDMARAAGVAALGVAWGYHAAAGLAATGAAAVAADLAAMDRWIEEWARDE